MNFKLNINSPYDTQLAFAEKLKRLRKQKKWSRDVLSEYSGVPTSTIKKFETTGEISFRQFLLLADKLMMLTKLHNLTKDEPNSPNSIEDVLNAK
ncbi:hypothetical protein CJF42_25915 [Pseudoalteromonas sp. NBT06-2]|uniref:helix-turn-helix domain-containing protein n=1 Tax=Pseudoalteromonas sp. NBT06-2 TaxID=2025950 RepID=UPI000BA73875|nr:helix-turn-helix domain-containing protein [Pseudoalteromonas sp. NBT06-2]PAJ71141.1 hypothetical protein CJF42_25915 [Pseudoalteromonas sp. NBT06-2]